MLSKMVKVMTISEALKTYPDTETELLLAHILGKSKEFVFTHGEVPLNPQQIHDLETLVRERRAGLPLAYITGIKNFYGLDFIVTKDTLIPRPETEQLVELAVSSYKLLVTSQHKNHNIKTVPALATSNNKLVIKPKVLDVGTGSGCIGITLKHLLRDDIEVVLSDISYAALEIAEYNADKHNVRVRTILSDLFQDISSKFHLIIANLPYVPVSDYNILHKGLKYEPKLALTDGTDTSSLIIRFLKDIQKHLEPGGCVLLEIDPTSKSYIETCVATYFPTSTSLDFIQDVFGRIRFCSIHTPIE